MQLRSLLSGHDALTLLEIERGSLNCNTEADFARLFKKIGNLFTFDFACTILGYRENDGFVVINGINISYPDEFLKIYKSRNYFQMDKVVRNNFNDYKIQYWGDKKNRLGQPDELISFVTEFNIKSGYAHGLKPFGFQKYGSLFSFAGTSMKPEARTNAILELIIPHLHLALSRLYFRKQSVACDIVLSGREKEVLNWVRHGKSSWDISVILNISERTVNFHIYNMMSKLGAVNRSQMVAVATRLGLIDIH